MRGRHTPRNTGLPAGVAGDESDAMPGRPARGRDEEAWRKAKKFTFWVSVFLTVALAAYMAYIVYLVIFVPFESLER